MSQPVRILLVGDSPTEARELLDLLHRKGFSPTAMRIETTDALRAALAAEHWDVMIADDAMPTASGTEALRLQEAMGLEVPVILIAARMSDERAREAIRAGAGDYLSRADLPSRLGLAVERALRDVRNRRARWQADAALRAAHQRLTETLESIQDAFYAVDRDWRFTYINHHAEAIWHRRRVDLLGKHIWEEFPQAVGSTPYQELQRAMRARQVVHLETVSPVIHTWIDLHAYPSADGGLTVYFSDITERKQAEEDQQRNLALTQQYLDVAGVMIVVLDREGCIVLLNTKGLDILGYTSAEICHQNWFQVAIPPRIRHEVHTIFQQLMTGQVDPVEYYENPVITKHGEERFLAFHNTLLRDEQGTIIGTLSSGEDITERRQAEEALRESETRFRQLADAMPQLVWTATPDGRMDYYNSRYREYQGVTPTGEEGHHWAPALHPDDLQRTIDAWERAVATGEVYQVEHRMRMADGAYRWHLSRGVPVRDEQGHITKWYGTATDIHDFRAIQEDRERLLHEVQRRVAELDATLASIADGLIIYSPTGEIILDNAAARRLLDDILIAEEFSSDLPQWMGQQARTPGGTPLTKENTPGARAARGETVTGEILVFRHRDGAEAWVAVTAAPIRQRDDTIIGVVSTYTDITALHELQEQQQVLIHLVSHDLRAPLTIIKGHVQLLQELMAQADINGMMLQGLQAVDRGIERMNAMIQDMVDAARAEGRQLELHREAVDLRAYLPELLRRSATALETGRIQVDLPDALPPVCADYNRLERIFLNLLSNALKYSTPGTPVLVRARRYQTQVEVSIIDQGQGIAPDDLPHLFQRFYRAKNAGNAEGLGLGLYITRQLVDAHGGQLRVESVVGAGSTFAFTLPVADDHRDQ